VSTPEGGVATDKNRREAKGYRCGLFEKVFKRNIAFESVEEVGFVMIAKGKNARMAWNLVAQTFYPEGGYEGQSVGFHLILLRAAPLAPADNA